MQQIIRELKRQVAGGKLTAEQLKALIRAGYVYRIGDEHHLTTQGREALAQAGANAADEHQPVDVR
jgi:ribosomal protein S19E (S16A)